MSEESKSIASEIAEESRSIVAGIADEPKSVLTGVVIVLVVCLFYWVAR